MVLFREIQYEIFFFFPLQSSFQIGYSHISCGIFHAISASHRLPGWKIPTIIWKENQETGNVRKCKHSL